mgnify:CR=1 FL=1
MSDTNKPSLYTIRMDEVQRDIIQQALQSLADSNSEHKHWDDLHMLLQMIIDLPQDEQEMLDAGHRAGETLHGFAL